MSKETSSVSIYVLKDRWVLVGCGERADNRLHISPCSVVRVWGTKKGLGELAHHGPRQETVLDPCGRVIVELHDLKFTIPCDTEAWDGEF